MSVPDSEGFEPKVTVRDLLAAPAVAAIAELVIADADLEREVTHPRIQKSGLVLVGHQVGVVSGRVQILGETEISFIEQLESAERRDRMVSLFSLGLSLVVVTRGVTPPSEMIEEAARSRTPLAVSRERSSATIRVFHDELDQCLAPVTRIHGVLVEVHGLGTLLTGPSGIGKSECALFLLERGGHRLVADDRVILTRLPSQRVVGRPAPLLRHHLEVRGLGILNIRDLFGATSVCDETNIDLVVHLTPWDQAEPYERLGIDDLMTDLLGVDVPTLRVPVRPGRDLAVIIEIAARNQLLKREGVHGARVFAERLAGEAEEPSPEKG